MGQITIPGTSTAQRYGVVQFAGPFTISYTDTTPVNLFKLPANSIMGLIYLTGVATFDDTGYDYLDIGNSDDGDRYVSNRTMTSPGNTVAALTSLKYGTSSEEQITAVYQGQNGDATQGQCKVLILYYVPG